MAEDYKRMNYLDIAKGIGIILVVLAHAMPRLSYVWVVINSFHMPLFFVISGILYKTKANWLSYLKRKLVSLYLPYVGCSLISLVPELIGGGYSLKQIIKLFLMLEPAPLLGAAWFIGALFYTLIVYDLAVRITVKIEFQLIILSVLAVVSLVIGLNIKTPIVLVNNILEAFFFVHCGFMCKKAKAHDKVGKAKYFFWLPLAAVLVIARYNNASFATNTYDSKILFLMAAICGTAAVLLFSGLIEEVKGFNWLIFLGKNTIGIVIWQFVSFKLVSLMQIAFYSLPIEKIQEYPVIYKYANFPWIFANTIVGITVSIAFYKILSLAVRVVWQRGKTLLN